MASKSQPVISDNSAERLWPPDGYASEVIAASGYFPNTLTQWCTNVILGPTRDLSTVPPRHCVQVGLILCSILLSMAGSRRNATVVEQWLFVIRRANLRNLHSSPGATNEQSSDIGPVYDATLIILAGKECNQYLATWSARFIHKRIVNVPYPDHIAVRRNLAFKWFRDQCTDPWLIMLDDDIVPVDGTEEFIRAQGDIVGARAWSRKGHESHPMSFSMAAVKIHRRVIEQIPPPWFQFTFNEDGTRLTQCECAYFWRRASEAGFDVIRAGKVGHRFPVTVVPGDDGPEFLFDKQTDQTMEGADGSPGASELDRPAVEDSVQQKAISSISSR